MKIAVIGAGAMGCMLGACLMEGGADVSLIVRRKELAEKYRSSGIRIKRYGSADLDFGPTPMKAATNVEGMEIQDAVLFMVKGPDTKTALEQTMPIIGDQTKVITLQNGVGNTEIIGEVIPKERIYYGCLNMSAIMEAPGVLTGALLGDNNVCLGSMVNGEEQKAFGEQICGLLKPSGIGAVYMENVDSEVWYKLLLNLTANAPCGIVRLRGGEAFENSDFFSIGTDIMREAIEVAAKLGVKIDMNHLTEHVIPNARKTSGLHYPSMAQDMMMKKTRTEIDFLNGAIERLGKQVGVPTPVNTTISRLVRTIEANYDRQYFPGQEQSCMDVGAPSYEMEMVRQDDDVLMPFAVMQNLFSPAKFANVYAYNGEDFYDIASVVDDIYGASSLAYSPNPYATKWYTGPFALRDNLGEAYAKYNYASMCLLLDLFFGHKEEMGIKNFDTFQVDIPMTEEEQAKILFQPKEIAKFVKEHQS